MLTECSSEGVGDPAHLPFSGAHVRSGNINTRSDESLLCKLDGKTPGDFLQLRFGELARINRQTGLGTTERHIHHSAFVRHERGKCLHLILAHMRVVTDTCGESEKRLIADFELKRRV